MYAMSWERDVSGYKYESIQDGYSVEFDENEIDPIEISLEEMVELEDEMELEELAEAI